MAIKTTIAVKKQKPTVKKPKTSPDNTPQRNRKNK
jgi:hypothetical protein